jgi:hypothetical protein
MNVVNKDVQMKGVTSHVTSGIVGMDRRTCQRLAGAFAPPDQIAGRVFDGNGAGREQRTVSGRVLPQPVPLAELSCGTGTAAGFYCSKQDKSGSKRRELDGEARFPGLLAWVISLWRSKELAIAIDATTLGQRFAVLAINVVVAGTAIPVAWKIIRADAKGSWSAHWLPLLRRFHQIVPADMKVIVLADRGLYAKWLFNAIVDLGWHPYLRINATAGEFRPAGAADYRCLTSLLPKPGMSHADRVALFRGRGNQLECTLVACWSEGCAEPWIIATDLAPACAKATWYGLRNWIERGFKHDKTGGLRWNNTRMNDPDRASVLWLVMAITRHLSILGGTKFHQPPVGASDKSSPQSRNPLLTGKTARPVLSVFVTGMLAIRAAIFTGRLPLPQALPPVPWPDSLPSHLSQRAPQPP